MLRNRFKVALRTILRRKWYAMQCIAGLSIALTVLILCLAFALYEYRFDRHYANFDRIFRVNTDLRLGEQEKKSANSSDVIGPLWRGFPQVETYARIFEANGFAVKKGETYLSESRGAFTDPSLFDVFDFPIISKGNDSLLAEPHTVVISSSTAKKYFGEENAVGRVIEIENLSHGKMTSGKYLVTAVTADQPSTASFAFDFLFPVADLSYTWGVNYAGAYFTTFVLLKDGADYQALNAQFKETTERNIYPIASRQLGLSGDSWEHFERAGNQMEFSLFPLTQIHLYSHREGELGKNSSMQTLVILGALTMFALLMGVVNFINLTTARVVERTGEIGVRKVLGSSRTGLIAQVFTEAFILLLVSLCLALVLTVILLPYVNDTLRTYLNYSDFLSPYFLSMVLVTTLLVGVASGWVPALYYSGIKPLATIQTKNRLRGSGLNLRKGLIVFQFFISVLMLIGIIVIYHQLRYIQQKDLGYDKEGVLVIQNYRSLKSQGDAFKEQILAIPGIISGSLTSSLPVNPSDMEGHFSSTPAEHGSGAIPLRNWWVDEDYLTTMGIELVAGTNFSEVAQRNVNRVIINQAAVKALGVDASANPTIFADDSTAYAVVGRVKDFHFESLHQAIGPLLLSYSPGADAAYAVFRFEKGSDINRLIEQVNKVWGTMTPTAAMDFYFLDEALNEVYWVYHSTLKIGFLIAVLAISIACIGLLGMITFITQQRTKEIGIRKVLGATVSGIVSLLAKDSVKLVLLATLIATPFSWWAMNKWLENFAYRIELQWWMFAMAGSAVLLIALLTISFQSVRAAVRNPVKSLKSE